MESNKNELIHSLKNSISDFLIDAAEISLDEIIESIIQDNTIIEKIPIIKWAYLLNNIKSNIQLAFFIRKYSRFIGPIFKEKNKDFLKEESLNKIINNNKTLNRIIEQTIIAVDRYQIEDKAEYLGRLFVKTFKDRIFTFEEYNLLLFSIELMHPYIGIECLKKFYVYKFNFESETEEEKKRKIWLDGSRLDFSPLSTTCLLDLPKGGAFTGDLGGARLNDLGKKFYENIVKEKEK